GGDGGAQGLVLFGLDHAHANSSEEGVPAGCTTASSVPGSTCRPVTACRAVTTPAAGAVILCCIFMASSHSRGCPASTAAPSDLGGDGGAQGLVLFGLDHAHANSSEEGVPAGCTTASSVPGSTCRPVTACRAVTTPAAGAVILCCIFMASSHSRGCPASTAAP